MSLTGMTIATPTSTRAQALWPRDRYCRLMAEAGGLSGAYDNLWILAEQAREAKSSMGGLAGATRGSDRGSTSIRSYVRR